MKQRYRYLHWKLITTGFGSGYAPFAPGTTGSLIALIPALLILNYAGNPNLLLAGLIMVFGITGFIGAEKLRHHWGKDPSRIVVDEMVGMWISLLWIGSNWIVIGMAFLFFRLFDICKPLGIRKAEKLPGGLGVMADDVLAGIYTNLLIRLFIIIYAMIL